MAFVGAIIAIAFAVVGELLRPKQALPNAKASSLDDLDIPTAEEGRAIYGIAGKVRLDATNCVWYGDLDVVPITKKVKTGWFSSARQTIGHQYKLGMAMGVCFGRPDFQIHKITFGEKEPKHTRTDEAEGVVRFDYDDPEFYGGENAEGGISGTLRFYRGTETQNANAYMTGILGETYPSYRSFCHTVMEKMWLGNTPYIKPVAYEVSSYPNQLGVPTNHHIIDQDANPICMIYELITQRVWAAGNPSSEVNAANFLAVAETIYTEGLGISMVYTGTATAEEYIIEILRHIDGVMFTNPENGMLEIKLARADYVINDLPILTKDDFEEGIKFDRPSWDETKNSIKATYTDRSADYTTAVIEMKDLANIMARSGEVAPEALEFTGFTKYEPAAAALARSLKTMAYPLASVQGPVLRRQGWNRKLGEVVRINWPELGLNGNVFRITAANYANMKRNAVDMQFLEDIFSVSAVPFTQPPPSGWVDPAQAALPLARQKLFELPLQFTGVEGAMVATLGSRSQGIDMGYDIYSGLVTGDVNLTYKDTTNDFTPSMVTTAEFISTSAYNATGFPVTGVIHGDQVPATVPDEVLYAGDSIALIVSAAGEELVAFKNFTGSAITGVVGGVYGTAPLTHPTGAVVWVLSAGFAVENITPYTQATPFSVYAKLLPFNALGKVAVTAVTQLSVSVIGKAAKQNPPRYVRADGFISPPPVNAGLGDIPVTWEWTDVKVQGGRISVGGSGSDPLPSGFSFTVRRYKNGALIDTDAGLTTFSYVYTIAEQNSDVNGNIEFRVSLIDSKGAETSYDSVTIPLTNVKTEQLLHLDGADGSTAIVDATGKPNWTAQGSSAIRTSQSKFGGASLEVNAGADGATSATAVGFGVGELTIEMWVYIRSLGSNPLILDCRSSDVDPAVVIDLSATTGFLGLYINGAFFAQDTVAMPLNTWVHVAATRDTSNDFRLYKNGVHVGASNSSISMPARVAHLGRRYNGASGRSIDGFIDEVRVSNVARYTGTGSFTPPPAPFTLD